MCTCYNQELVLYLCLSVFIQYSIELTYLEWVFHLELLITANWTLHSKHKHIPTCFRLICREKLRIRAASHHQDFCRPHRPIPTLVPFSPLELEHPLIVTILFRDVHCRLPRTKIGPPTRLTNVPLWDAFRKMQTSYSYSSCNTHPEPWCGSPPHLLLPVKQRHKYQLNPHVVLVLLRQWMMVDTSNCSRGVKRAHHGAPQKWEEQDDSLLSLLSSLDASSVVEWRLLSDGVEDYCRFGFFCWSCCCCHLWRSTNGYLCTLTPSSSLDADCGFPLDWRYPIAIRWKYDGRYCKRRMEHIVGKWRRMVGRGGPPSNSWSNRPPRKGSDSRGVDLDFVPALEIWLSKIWLRYLLERRWLGGSRLFLIALWA